MNQDIKKYIDSFKLNRFFLNSLITDAVCWGIIVVLFILASNYLTTLAGQLTGGRTPEAFQQYILTLSESQLQAYYLQIRSFVIQIIAGFILIPIAALMIYSLGQAILYGKFASLKPVKNMSAKGEFKHWRWNWLHLVMFFLFIIGIIAALLLKMITDFLGEGIIAALIFATLLSILTATYLTLLVNAQSQFGTYYKVWKSIGNAFSSLKNGWLALTFASGTFLALQLLQYPLRNVYAANPTFSQAAQAVILLLYIGWLRVYSGQFGKELSKA